MFRESVVMPALLSTVDFSGSLGPCGVACDHCHTGAAMQGLAPPAASPRVVGAKEKLECVGLPVECMCSCACTICVRARECACFPVPRKLLWLSTHWGSKVLECHVRYSICVVMAADGNYAAAVKEAEL